jgi:Zn-dependent protease with chaperone function
MSSQHLLDRMLKEQPSKVRFTPTRLIAGFIAACVHGMTIVFFALGLWLSIFAFPMARFLGVFLGLVCFVIFWFLLPRFPKITAKQLFRERFPTLYQTADRIASSIGSPLVDSIHYDLKYNAAFGRYGWKRKRCLILGLPLISALNDQELVALLAHELAHNVNGDPNRSLLLGTAVHSLASWYEIIHPKNRWHIQVGIGGIILLFFNIICLPLAGLIWVVLYVLSRLLWYDTQQSEYLADWLAAQVSGTDAQLSVLAKSQLREVFENTIKFSYLGHQMDSFFINLSQRIAQAPVHAVERLWQNEEKTHSGIGSTHPSTLDRIAFLKAHNVQEAKIRLSSSQHTQLEQEFEPLLKNIHERISELDEITFREIFGIVW